MNPICEYWNNGNIRTAFYKNEKGFHREDGPAFQEWFHDGKIKGECYSINGLTHREDGPASLSWFIDGRIKEERWFINGKEHREDGPSRRSWFYDGTLFIEHYKVNGETHRINNPAYRVRERNKPFKELYYYNGHILYPEWFTKFGKDINNDMEDEALVMMLINLYSARKPIILDIMSYPMYDL